MIDSKKVKLLEQKAIDLRILGLEMVQKANSGHLGGAFSLSELITVLYFQEMNICPEKPDWEDRDRLVLSKGHATVALYPALAMRDFFPKKRLDTFRKIDGQLSGHAEMTHVPGVDMSTGSLGQGLSAAVGIALAGRLQAKTYYTYAIIGDGELQEGQIWEAAMFAAGNALDHLIVIVDNNGVQLDGPVSEILNTGDLQAKFQGFGFHTQTIEGHDIVQIIEAIHAAKSVTDKPHAIIAKTIKGKGVSFMEGRSEWHGKTPNKEEFDAAFEELYAWKKRIS